LHSGSGKGIFTNRFTVRTQEVVEPFQNVENGIKSYDTAHLSGIK
jgi:hypothetical protein